MMNGELKMENGEFLPTARRARRPWRILNSPFLILHSRSDGFTLMEMVLVLAITAILLTLIVPVSQQFQVNALLTSETAALVTDLRRAQAAAVAGANDTSQGVHFDPTPTDQWVLFPGSTYTPGAVENEVHTLSSGLDMTAVALQGGGQDILFAERRGTTTNTGTITLQTLNGQTRTIVVNERGLVEIN
ncbi:MAG: prepilin-type N-terminal cleavage/methylation domain-containing protein [bacterium]|nr:prepilin-type N-terminal cleavage/methylation domain-containing protein [bacterium]